MTDELTPDSVKRSGVTSASTPYLLSNLISFICNSSLILCIGKKTRKFNRQDACWHPWALSGENIWSMCRGKGTASLRPFLQWHIASLGLEGIEAALYSFPSSHGSGNRFNSWNWFQRRAMVRRKMVPAWHFIIGCVLILIYQELGCVHQKETCHYFC